MNHDVDPIPERTYRRFLAAILMVQGLVLLGSLPWTVLSRIDEAQIAEVAKEMAATGDWLTPRIGGVPYAPYPPLEYWILASVGSLLGFSEVTMRLPTAIAAVFLVAVVARLARRMAGERAGLAAALVLASLPCLLVQGIVCRADVLTALLATAAFDRYHAWCTAGRRSADLILLYVFTGLGILAKGPIALAMLGIGGLAWCAVRREWKSLPGLRLWLGIPATALLVLPWYIAVDRVNGPEFLRENLFLENVRAFTDGYQQKRSPVFYLRSLPAAALPWLLLLAAAWKSRRAAGLDFSLAWAAGMLVLLSVSSAKRLNYLTYLAPPLALAAGIILADLWTRHPNTLRKGIAAYCVVLLALLAGLCALPASCWTGGAIAAVASYFGRIALAAAPVILAVLLLNWRWGPIAASTAIAATAAAGMVIHAVAIQPMLDSEDRTVVAFYRRSSASLPPGERLVLPTGGGMDGLCHFYADGPLEFRAGGSGHYLISEAQKKSFDQTGTPYRILDSVPGQRGRGRFLVKVGSD